MRGVSKITSYLLSALFLLVVFSEQSWGQVSDEVLNEANSGKVGKRLFQKTFEQRSKRGLSISAPCL